MTFSSSNRVWPQKLVYQCFLCFLAFKKLPIQNTLRKQQQSFLLRLTIRLLYWMCCVSLLELEMRYRGVQQKTIERFYIYREDLLSVLAEFFFLGWLVSFTMPQQKFGSQGWLPYSCVPITKTPLSKIY